MSLAAEDHSALNSVAMQISQCASSETGPYHIVFVTNILPKILLLKLYPAAFPMQQTWIMSTCRRHVSSLFLALRFPAGCAGETFRQEELALRPA